MVKERETTEVLQDKKVDVIEENKEVQEENKVKNNIVKIQVEKPKKWNDKPILSFDKVARTQKARTCISFMYAVTQSFESLKNDKKFETLEIKNTVEETVKLDTNDSEDVKKLKQDFVNVYYEKVFYRLRNAFNLFREDLDKKEDGAGEFGEALPIELEDCIFIKEQSLNNQQIVKTKAQFQRVYSIARECGVLINQYSDISDLAKKVIQGNITIKEYFDIIYCNYIFIIDNKVLLLVYKLVNYLKKKNKREFSKEDIKNCLGEQYVNNESLNGTMEWLSEGTFFIQKQNSKEIILEVNPNISYDYILERCNTEYSNKTCDDIKDKKSPLKYQLGYSEYLTTSIKDVKKLNKSDYIKQGINLIYYGAPGTGKSYKINIEYPDNQYRCILYSDFEYSDFVGSIGPVINIENGKKATMYEFIPGIFTKVLKEAINNPTGVYNLIIEELNRADSCNVFGDIFQMLDREDGFSKYSICNKNIAEYIYESDKDYTDLDVDVNKNEIRIPSNLNIVCTMNTSDKNINSFDSAFIRRWKREYIHIDFIGKQLNGKDLSSYEINGFNYNGKPITWVAFAETINDYIVDSNIPNKEDKQLGPYFIKPETLDTPESFANDVLVYLFTDVFKFELNIIFKEKIKSINSLISNFLKDPEEVFNDDVLDKFYNYNNANSSN